MQARGRSSGPGRLQDSQRLRPRCSWLRSLLFPAGFGSLTGMNPIEVHVHVHLDGTHHLEGLILATKDEILAALDTLTASLTELSHDVARLAQDLADAVAANDLTAVADKVTALQAVATAIDDAVEAASPEPPVEPPV